MNNIITKLFTLAVLLFANTQIWAGPEITEIEYESEYWPEFIRIQEPMLSHDGERTFRKGWRFIMITLDQGIVTADSGSHGLYDIPVEDTDFIEQYEAIKADKQQKLMGNVTLMIGNKLFDPMDNEVAYKYERMTPVNYYLLYYPTSDYYEQDPNFSQLFDIYNQTKANKRFELVMFPGESSHAELLENLENHSIPWTTLSFYFTEGYRKSLNHVPEGPANQLVLVDMNNKMIAHSDEVGTEAVLAKLDELLLSEPDESQISAEEASTEVNDATPLSEGDIATK